jgi:RNA polymerase sigma factor (sigma-70 family)
MLMTPSISEEGRVFDDCLGGSGDEWLVSAAKSGDRSAFAELCNRDASKILGRIYRITRNWQDAEDVLQEAMLKAFVHLRDFECRSGFSSWLTRIAINSALMMLRKRRCVEVSIDTTNHPEAGQTWEPWDLGPDPESCYVQRERGIARGRHPPATAYFSGRDSTATYARMLTDRDCADSRHLFGGGQVKAVARKDSVARFIAIRGTRVHSVWNSQDEHGRELNPDPRDRANAGRLAPCYSTVERWRLWETCSPVTGPTLYAYMLAGARILTLTPHALGLICAISQHRVLGNKGIWGAASDFVRLVLEMLLLRRQL